MYYARKSNLLYFLMKIFSILLGLRKYFPLSKATLSREELLAAASEGRGDEVVKILEADPELVRVGDPVGDTALHVLARAGHVDALGQLIRFLQSKTNYRELLSTVAKQGNGDGDTPLHLAVKNVNRHMEAVILLYEAERRAKYVRNDDGKCFRDLVNELEDTYLNKLSILGYEEDLCESATPNVGMGMADVEMDLERTELENTDVQMLRFNPKPVADPRTESSEQDRLNTLNPLWIRHRPKPLQIENKHNGNTLFHDAAYSGNMKMLTNLFQLKPSMRILLDRNFCGETALHLAIRRRHTKVASYLIKMAPEAVYQVNDKEESPLYLAIKQGDYDLMKDMLQLIPISAVPSAIKHALLNPEKRSLPHAAIRSMNLTMLQDLLESLPILIDSLDEKEWKPLSYAAYKAYFDEVRYMLKSFPESVKKFDGDGSLPIHKAVVGGHISIFKEFISCHPQTLYDIDNKGRTILHIAVRYTKYDILTYVTRKINDAQKILDARDHDGKTFTDLAKNLKHN